MIRGVVHGCIGGCCSKEYPTVFANLADKKIWDFVMEEGLKPHTIYVDTKSDLSSDKKEKDKSKFYIDKVIKIKGNEIHLDLEVKKKHAMIGGIGGALVLILIIGTIIFCCCRRRRRR